MYKHYKIITSQFVGLNPDILKFQNEVKEHLLQGWKCQGGVVEISDRSLIQAMVK